MVQRRVLRFSAHISMKATKALIEEHEAVKTVLQVLKKINSKIEKGENINVSHLEEIVEFFQIFVDQCHHSKEEVDLFPAIESFGYEADGELIKELQDEHQKGRMIVRSIKDAIDGYKGGNEALVTEIGGNISALISLFEEHTKKEDTILFPRADKLLSEDDQNEMYDQFEDIERDVIGLGRHEEFHILIGELKKIYL